SGLQQVHTSAEKAKPSLDLGSGVKARKSSELTLITSRVLQSKLWVLGVSIRETPAVLHSSTQSPITTQRFRKASSVGMPALPRAPPRRLSAGQGSADRLQPRETRRAVLCNAPPSRADRSHPEVGRSAPGLQRLSPFRQPRLRSRSRGRAAGRKGTLCIGRDSGGPSRAGRSGRHR